MLFLWHCQISPPNEPQKVGERLSLGDGIRRAPPVPIGAVTLALRPAAAGTVEPAETVHPVTAGAWQGCPLRFEVAEQRGLRCIGNRAFMGPASVFLCHHPPPGGLRRCPRLPDHHHSL
jgi:hypothetical protein